VPSSTGRRAAISSRVCCCWPTISKPVQVQRLSAAAGAGSAAAAGVGSPAVVAVLQPVGGEGDGEQEKDGWAERGHGSSTPSCV
jgi:hypothetical protein